MPEEDLHLSDQTRFQAHWNARSVARFPACAERPLHPKSLLWHFLHRELATNGRAVEWKPAPLPRSCSIVTSTPRPNLDSRFNYTHREKREHSNGKNSFAKEL